MTAQDRKASHGSSEAALSTPGSGDIVTVRPADEVLSRQKLPYFVGISEATAGAKGISMNLIIIPPGGAAQPHLHQGYETAIYLLQGRVETRFGPGLSRSIINQAGDFLFIPANLPRAKVYPTIAELSVVPRMHHSTITSVFTSWRLKFIFDIASG